MLKAILGYVEKLGSRISCGLHNKLFHDYPQSLCSRAYWLRSMYPFWAWWVRLMGEGHCRRSYDKHWWGKK